MTATTTAASINAIAMRIYRDVPSGDIVDMFQPLIDEAQAEGRWLDANRLMTERRETFERALKEAIVRLPVEIRLAVTKVIEDYNGCDLSE